MYHAYSMVQQEQDAKEWIYKISTSSLLIVLDLTVLLSDYGIIGIFSSYFKKYFFVIKFMETYKGKIV